MRHPDESIEAYNEKLWLERYQYLIDFHHENGHSKVPRDFIDPSGHSLFNWCQYQKRLYFNNKLRKDRISLLEKLDFWTWNRKYRPRKWEVNFRAFLRYIKKYNKYPYHLSRLGIWYQLQKTKYSKGELEQEKINLFKKEKISLITQSPPEWEDNFIELKKAGRIPRHATQLGRWCYKQKHKYRKKKLVQSKVKKLESLSFWSWKIKSGGQSWNQSYKEFKKLLKSGGAFPKRHDPLGAWFFKQRGRIKHNKISEKQLKKLRDIEGWKW